MFAVIAVAVTPGVRIADTGQGCKALKMMTATTPREHPDGEISISAGDRSLAAYRR